MSKSKVTKLQEAKSKEEKAERGDELAFQLSACAGTVLSLIPKLPDDRMGRYVADQLQRSALSPGAHYGEARGAQSRRDFLHKLSLALKELRESVHWLRVALGAEWLDEGGEEVIEESMELVRILAASQQTVRRNMGG